MKTTLMYAIVGVSWFALSASSSAEEPAVIADNSFFIEEAYNQEPGVVQHILNAAYFTKPAKEAAFSFTEEVPLGGMRHQGSFTALVKAFEGEGAAFEEVAIHYRYQLLSGERGIAVSPRVSLSIATVNSGTRDEGDIGYQFNLPVSINLANRLVSHVNAGATISPNIPWSNGFDSGDNTLVTYNLGGSIILLATPTLNAMFEIVQIWEAFAAGGSTVEFAEETIVSPGLRFAINSGSLQIVPGIGIPFRFSDGETTTGVFGYLSLEHPF